MYSVQKSFSYIGCKCKLFSHEFQSGKAFLRCPKLETGFLALPLRPQAIVVFGVHRGSIRKQELCSLDLALARHPVQQRPTSGAFPGAVGRCGFWRTTAQEAEAAETTKVIRFKRQTNDECFGLNIFKYVQCKKTQTPSTSFSTSFLPLT